MAINFPNSPTVNETFTTGTDTWIWDGVTWGVAAVDSPNFTDISVSGNVIGNVIGNVTGQHTGNVIGNVTGNVTGNVIGNVTGDLTGNVTGNASTATLLQTGRNINGVSFNGSANITVPAAANTLTGSTINPSVTSSSLTSVGTLNNLTVTNDITANANVVINQTPQLPTHAANKRYTDSRAIAFSVALS
jgi:hypothetical protein